ncbi:5'-methylthioadenosine/S-adenosylhomocysteine nucleosidase family protein [Petrotoga sp. DB-2]
MLYIISAMGIEARAIIKYLNLKKTTDRPFETYQNEEVHLVISGVGKINAAGATSYLLKDTLKDLNHSDYAINLGICGSLNNKFNVGDLVLVNKVVDYERKRKYYTDILVKHNQKEGSIQSIDTLHSNYEFEEDLVDMESSAFFEIASKFLSVHQVYVLKIVSDKVSKNQPLERLTKKYIDELIYDKLEEIFSFTKLVSSLLKLFQPILQQQDEEIIEKVSKSLKLTFSQTKQLENAYAYFKSNKKVSPLFLKEYFNYIPKSKKERDAIFEDLKTKLYK